MNNSLPLNEVNMYFTKFQDRLEQERIHLQNSEFESKSKLAMITYNLAQRVDLLSKLRCSNESLSCSYEKIDYTNQKTQDYLNSYAQIVNSQKHENGETFSQVGNDMLINDTCWKNFNNIRDQVNQELIQARRRLAALMNYSESKFPLGKQMQDWEEELRRLDVVSDKKCQLETLDNLHNRATRQVYVLATAERVIPTLPQRTYPFMTIANFPQKSFIDLEIIHLTENRKNLDNFLQRINEKRRSLIEKKNTLQPTISLSKDDTVFGPRTLTVQEKNMTGSDFYRSVVFNKKLEINFQNKKITILRNNK